MKNQDPYPRRRMPKSTAAFAGLATLTPWWDLLARDSSRKYRISACDWSIGKTSEVAALELGSRIGLDGVQVSLGTVKNNMHLRQVQVQLAYQAAARQHGVQVSSLAIGELNNVPYKSAPEAEAWVSESIDVAKAMGCKVILLAFFNKGDLKGDEAGKQ